MKIDLSIDPKETVQRIVVFVQKVFRNANTEKIVVGVSGGIDSVVSLVLSAEALGGNRIFPVILPYGVLSSEGEVHARLVFSQLNIPDKNIVRLDIKPVADMIFSTDETLNKLRKGNIMTRLRMIKLFDLAKKISGLVMGTENKTEHLLGYFTRFGDAASDIEPIIHLYKTQVKELALYLNIPKEIIEKAPSAGLWPGQTDEDELGFTYKDADQILYQYIDRKIEIEQIIQAGWKKETVEKIVSRYLQNRFKHDTPYSLL